jgi:hypothetical protein
MEHDWRLLVHLRVRPHANVMITLVGFIVLGGTAHAATTSED